MSASVALVQRLHAAVHPSPSPGYVQRLVFEGDTSAPTPITKLRAIIGWVPTAQQWAYGQPDVTAPTTVQGPYVSAAGCLVPPFLLGTGASAAEAAGNGLCAMAQSALADLLVSMLPPGVTFPQSFGGA